MSTSHTPAARPNAGLYESRFEHEALFEFSKVINSSLDLNFILSHVLLTIMGKTLLSRGMVILAHGKGAYRVEMVKGFARDLVGADIQIKSISRSLFNVKTLGANRYPWITFFEDCGVRILLPMFIADKPIGLLGFGERFSRKPIQKKEKTYLLSLANIAATAIEKCHTIEELQHVNRKLDRKFQELNTLFELGKEFNALLDPDKVVRLLVFSLLGQIGVNRYLVCLKQGADIRVAASKTDGPAPQPEFLRTLTSVKKASRIGDIAVRHAQDPRPALSAMGMTVIIPMRTQEETKGIIFVGDKLSKERFTEADLEFLAALANLAIISLENARLFKDAIEKQKLEDELLIAREIQKGLLPSSLPSIPGFEIAAANISSKQVGGDYYDVIALQDGKYVIAIGDVSGKGSPAALLMANLQATIRALVPLHITLSELTRRVNDLMCSNTGGSKFVTFFWGVLDPATRTLRYVNAGHNYPYVVREDGSLERLEKGGMILGVMPAVVPYEEGSVTFSPREFLILFTDGVSEAMSKDGEEYGEQRLESSLLQSRTGGAQDLLTAIHQAILQFTQGASQSDDITMMIVKIT